MPRLLCWGGCLARSPASIFPQADLRAQGHGRHCLNVEKRERTGTGGRAPREVGPHSGVFMAACAAVPIEIKAKDVEMALRSGKFVSHMVELTTRAKSSR